MGLPFGFRRVNAERIVVLQLSKKLQIHFRPGDPHPKPYDPGAPPAVDCKTLKTVTCLSRLLLLSIFLSDNRIWGQ